MALESYYTVKEAQNADCGADQRSHASFSLEDVMTNDLRHTVMMKLCMSSFARKCYYYHPPHIAVVSKSVIHPTAGWEMSLPFDSGNFSTKYIFWATASTLSGIFRLDTTNYFRVLIRTISRWSWVLLTYVVMGTSLAHCSIVLDILCLQRAAHTSCRDHITWCSSWASNRQWHKCEAE